MGRKIMSLIVALGALLAVSVHPAGAIVVEKDLTVPTAWKYYTSATPSGIVSALGSTYRLIDLEIKDASPLTFAAAMVKNAGGYVTPSWHWYYDKTAAQVTGLSVITSGQERVIDIESYEAPAGTRYAVITVNNQGSYAKAWWWYLNASTSYIASHLAGRRITHLSTHAGTTGYDVVMIANRGSDATAWWYYYRQAPSSITTRINNNHARLIDIEPDGSGTFTVVMAASPSARWWWFFDQSSSSVSFRVNKYIARVATIKSYSLGESTLYAVILLDNAKGTESGRLRDIMLANGTLGGTFGIYLRKVGGPTIVNYQGSTQFEPASALKVLHHLYTMERIQAGAISNSTLVAFWRDPDPTVDGPNVCPDPAWETAANQVNVTMKTALYGMLQDSDNRMTRGFEVRWGRSTLNARAAALGMGGTSLAQRIGCGNQGGLANATTMADLGKIYEGVSNASLLSGGSRSQFWSLLIGGAPGSGIKAIVDNEASKLGMSSSVANAFYGEMEVRSKGGSYDMCFPTGPCSPPYDYVRAVAGRLTIPFKSGGNIVPTDYVFGRFVDGMSINCPFQGTTPGPTYGTQCPAWANANATLGTAYNELFRSQIRAALQTW